MNKKALQWLYQELPDLVNKGVLSSETANKIKEHYGQVKVQDKRWMFLIVCGVIGALLIGLGIIMLIAHNWDMLSRATRAFLSMLPLLVGQSLVGWTLWKKPESDAFKESSATFLSLMVGASISLISQTYNISGDISSFILTWMFLILPVVYLMRATIAAAIYVIGITCWAGNFWDDPLMAIIYWPLLALVIPHFIWSLRRKVYTLRSTTLALIISASVCFGAGFSLGKTWSDSWTVIYSSIAALLYLIGSWKFNKISVNWQRPFRVIGSLGVIGLAFIFTFSYSWHPGFHFYLGILQPAYLPDHVIALAIIGSALLLFRDCLVKGYKIKSLFGALPLLALVAYAFNANNLIFLSMLLFNIYILALSISYISLGIRNNHLGLANVGMLILAILIIVRFFDSDISFIIKGLVFIIIGSGFLVTNAVLARRMGVKNEK